MLHGTKQLSIRSCLRSVTFLSPNKKVTKEVGLGGGAECLTPEAKAVNYGILATGKYWYYRFAARSTTLPLRTLSRRAFYRVLSLFQFAFARLSYILYLVSYISLTSTFGFTTYHILRGWFLEAYFLPEKMSNGVGSLCITEEMRGQARFVLTFCEIWIRMTVSKLPI